MNRRNFIGLGGNVGNRHALLDAALNEIQLAFPCVQERSSRFETPAWGMAPDTPAFLNQVISISLPEAIEPLFVLEALLAIEQKLGRHRAAKAEGTNRVPLTSTCSQSKGCAWKQSLDPAPSADAPAPVCVGAVGGAGVRTAIDCGGPTVAELLRTCTDESAVQRLETTP